MVWSMGVCWYVLVFHPFWPFFFRFKLCFLAPFTALGVERLLETPPFLVRLCSILSRFCFSKKEISMVDAYIPPSKKEQTKGSPETCLFFLVGRFSFLVVKTQKLPWKIWMGPFSHQIYSIFPCCFFGFCFRPKMKFRDPNGHPPPLGRLGPETSTLRFPRSKFERRTERGLPGATVGKTGGFCCSGLKFHYRSTRSIHVTGMFTYIYHKNHPNVGKCTIHGLYAACWRVPTFW